MLLAALVVLLLIGILMNWHGKGNVLYNTILGVIATLGIFSILYKENPVFRFCEHIFIGLAAGYGAVYLWVTVLIPRWWTPMTPPPLHSTAATATDDAVRQGHWWMIFCLLLALLFYTVYFQKTRLDEPVPALGVDGVFRGRRLFGVYGAIRAAVDGGLPAAGHQL